MPREGDVLGQAGISIPDVYDVVGSQAKIERLSSEEPQYVHELGAAIFSERFSSTIRRVQSAALAQNTDFDLFITDMPAQATRIFGAGIFANSNRITHAMAAVRDPDSQREMPFYVWDVNESTVTMRIQDDGGAVSALTYLQPSFIQMPSMLAGRDQPQRVPDIAFRGRTTAFGAGTVNVTLVLHIGLAQIGGVSSYGLPLPGW